MKKILTKLFFITLLLSAQNVFAGTGPFSGGSGLVGNPYQISNATDLKAIGDSMIAWGRNYVGIYFQQTIDITLSSPSTPIGDDSHEFRGIYHGAGHKITGLSIPAGTGYTGLFAYLKAATIDNLGVEGSVTGPNHVGLLAGATDVGCTISNCYSAGSVTVNTSGGLAGGLLGSSYDNGTVSNCYSTALVSAGGAWEVGGLIGIINGGNTIANCYSIGAVTGAADYTGGLIGHNVNTGTNTFSSCYWNTTTSGRTNGVGDGSGGNTPTGITGEVTADMKLQSTYTAAPAPSWDITGTVWRIDLSGTLFGGYPFLAWQNPSGGTTLPVELTSFTSAVSKSGVTLKWSTATEVNNYGFNVERRAVTSAGSWMKIGFVAGHGTSNSTKAYSYNDAGLASGSYAYRLKQIDNGGAFKYSQSIQLDISLTPTVIGLSQNYPNPFNPSTLITFSVATTEQAKLVVYNILGQPVVTLFDGVANGQQAYQLRLDASKLSTGVYFYKLETPSRTDVRRMQLLK
jgi:hypothetical protein